MPALRKSLEQHQVEGTKPNGRAADVSHVAASRPKFPRDLDATLKPIFKRLCALLQERRTLTSADGELLRLYCFQWERHSKNVALLRNEGEIVTYTRLDSNGQAHPQVRANLRLKVVSDAERQMAALLNQLGFSPTAKDRAKPTKLAEKEKPVDLMEAYMSGQTLVFPNSAGPIAVNPADMVWEDPTSEPEEPDTR